MKKYLKKSVALFLSMVLALGLAGNILLLTANAAEAATGSLALSGKTSEAITVDGKLTESVWSERDSYSVEILADSTINNNVSSFTTAWDDETFYIAMSVEDATVVTAENGIIHDNIYENDGVEFFIDAQNDKAKWDNNDFHLFIQHDGKLIVWGGSSGAWSATDELDGKIEHAVAMTDEGFSVEVAISWEALGVTPKDGTLIGFGVTNDDNDSYQTNARKEITWVPGQGGGQPASWGTLCLYDTRKPVISTEGTPSVDNGNAVWNADIWNFNADHSLNFPNIPGATVKFASLSDTEAFYLGMLIEGAGNSQPFVEVILDGDNTRSGDVVAGAGNYGYVLQWNPLAEEEWQQMNFAKGEKDGTSSGRFHLGNGSYAVTVSIPWSLLTDADENGDVIRQDHTLLSFSIAAGTCSGNGISDDAARWTASNAWTGGNALEQAATIIIDNPNIVPLGNVAPTGTIYYTYSIPQGGNAAGAVKVSDANEDDILTYKLDESYDQTLGAVTLDGAKWTYTAPADYTGRDNFYVIASDPQGESFRTRIEIRIESTPTSLTYYVNGNSGNDANDGLSSATALKTIDAANGKVKPGDTVLIYESATPYGWETGTVRLTSSGLPGAPITFKAAEGENPVIKVNAAGNVVVITGSYVNLEGLTVLGQCDELTYDDAWASFWGRIADPEDPGYQGGSYNKCNSDGIYFRPEKDISSLNDLLEVEYSIPHHISISNCVVEYMGGTGIGGKQSDYVTIENCTVMNNCWWGQWGNSGISFNETVDVDDNTETYKLIIRNNISAGNRHFIPWTSTTVRLSDGNGIIMDMCDEHMYSYQGRTLIANNLAYENGGSGIHAFRADNVDIINNTVFNNGATPEMAWREMFADDSENVRIINNIIYSRTGNREDTGKPSLYDNNIFYNYKAGSPVDTLSSAGEHNQYGVDPLFAMSEAVVHMPEGFNVETDYPEDWYVTKNAAEGRNPNEWSKAANAAAAGWYPGVSYDVTGYGYDFTLSANSPAVGAANSEWQAIAGGKEYANRIGIFSEAGAGVRASSETSASSFTDVEPSAWYHDEVQYVTSRGLMTGTNGKFEPSGVATIGQLASALYRLEGSPTGYDDAIDWSIANDVIVSTDGNVQSKILLSRAAGEDGSQLEIAREDVAVILYRYAVYKNYDVSADGDLSHFSDGAHVSSPAREAMTWAVGTGLFTGYDGGQLMPQNPVTRAQTAAVLMRFCENNA